MDVDVEEAVVGVGSFIQIGEPTSPGSSHLKYTGFKMPSSLFSLLFASPLSHPHIFILVIHASTVIVLKMENKKFYTESIN